MTYYKYKGPETQINWAKVGKNMSDMLATEQNAREEKKEQIDTQQREDLKYINEAPTGDFMYGNTVYSQISTDMQEAMKLNSDALKSGRMSVQDYTRNRQNIMDNTSMLFDLGQEYQDEYSVKMERLDNLTSSYREQWEMAQVEGLGNLKNVRVIIDSSGDFKIAKMVKNPDTGVFEVSKNPNDVVSVSEMRNRLKSQYNRFDVGKAATNAAGQLGAVEKTILKDATRAGGLGQLITTIDATEGDYTIDEGLISTYKDWENDQVGAMMSNPENISSVLVDMKLNAPSGEKYEFTYDKDAFDKDKTGSLIYLDREQDGRGVPVFKKGQREEVENTLRTAIRASIDEKNQIKATSRKPYPQRAAATKPPAKEDAVFEAQFNIRESKKLKNAQGQWISGEAEIRKALTELPGLYGRKYRVEDGLQQVYYIGEDGKEVIEVETEEGGNIAELLLNVSRNNSMLEGGQYSDAASRKTYAGKKKSGTTTNSTGGTSR